MRLRSCIIFFLILVWPIILFAATRNADTDGNWSDTGTWTGGNIPVSTDDVTTSNNVDLTVESTDDVSVITFAPALTNTLTIDAGGQLTLNNSGLDAMIVSNNFTLTVDGTLVINGNLDVSNNLVLNVTGDVIINGDVNVSNGASLSVTSTGTITISGDFTGGNNTDVDVEGTIDVGGSVTVGNGSDLTGGGTFFAAGGCTGDVNFCESGTFPVKLLYFRANSDNAQVQLEWATYEQVNFDYFCIERSENGLNYDCIEEISGVESSETIISYSTNDKAPLPGRSYYRLKAVDLDQSFEYFNIIRIDRDLENRFAIYPNPTEGRFTIRLNFIPGENLKYTVFDLRGLVYESENLVSHQSEFQNTRNLSPGLYMIMLTDDYGYRESLKLLVH